MSESSQESSRSNKDGNRRVTVAYFSTEGQEEGDTHTHTHTRVLEEAKRGEWDADLGVKCPADPERATS